MTFERFGIIGAGAWGTALAAVLARAGREAILWAREQDVVTAIRERHENSVFLPGIALDPAIRASRDLADLKTCQAWLSVVPVQHTRAICEKIATLGADQKKPIVLCSKGIERDRFRFPSAIVAEVLPGHPLAALSGPSFAVEVARGQPTAVTLACADEALGMALSQAMGGPTFRPYLSDDLIGVQLGGAIKNVLAVACGIAAGCGMGENARAALMTRGLAEMMRLGLALGARAETLMGLSGMGDLVLTCSSLQSRNMSLGVAVGQGQRLEDILSSRQSVAEGVPTAAAAVRLAAEKGVDMPLCAAVDAILHKGARVDETISTLLARPLKTER